MALDAQNITRSKKDQEHIKKEAKILIGGNNTTSSLRTYVNNAYKSIKKREEQNTSVLFKSTNIDNDLFTCEESQLGEAPKKVSKTSAHEIKVYRGDNNLFFMKPFNQSSREYQKNIDNGIAEVVYAQIWRYLIGERASESRLVTKNGNIIGICSKGLKGFTEYGKMTNQDKLDTKGLISILVFVYLLMEDDFHIFNYGQMSFENDKDKYFGKIDHDYIVDKWNILSKDSTKFKISELSKVLKSKNLASFINLLSANSRFNPASGNDFMLRAAHTARAKMSSRKKTTTSRSQAAFFRSNLATRDNVNEFDKTINTIKQRCNNLENDLSKPLKKQLANFKGKYPGVKTDKAEQILTFFIQRMQTLKNELN
ncbi:hypothetical protein [Francisella uliginis]|uniref:LepB N-terminal domain-containing protein n=1 Tax=Francisella uliginis TaxID=573570 RepID=A0A1L4BUZ3_9GAMM|nr:hypothetical protein [Francisella uliginis]API87653.1 hypothetical protein F7310_09960 [Francisella uliginis]